MARSLITRVKHHLIKEVYGKPTLIKTKSYKFTFGKHRDETLEEVLESDPSYIIWANDNVRWFKVSKKILDDAKKLYTPRRRSYYSGYDPDCDSWYGAVDPYDFCD